MAYPELEVTAVTILNTDTLQPELRLYFGRSGASRRLRRLNLFNCVYVCHSQWPLGLRRGSAAARAWDCGFESHPGGIDVYLLLVFCFVR